MLRASFKTMRLEVTLLLCIVAVTLAPGRCGTEESVDEERARLPQFLSELDLASLEASEEDVEALKKVVKRLAPEKNVFFGNEDLLNEWLKGAGVTGQPGVDFPALTTIPVTSFSCRGLKGGYYADLETNCQVFHICDNGRKISFLCPNGTIFQQSQLICDWWFKVDCSRSAELYEQSAEQLAEEERKRAEAKRMNSEFHRNSDSEEVRSYENPARNADYDGRQNARMNPYGQSAKRNQIADNQRSVKSNEPSFSQPFNQPARNQYPRNNDADYQEDGRKGKSSEENYQEQGFRATSYHQSPSNRQQNQLLSEQKSEQYHPYSSQRGSSKYTSKDYQVTASARNEDYYGSAANQNTARTETPKNGKSGPSSRVNANNNNVGVAADQKVTPTYTETTTFRTTTGSPIKEFQQLAESAAFVSSRGNHYNNKAYNSQQYNYQQSHTNQPSDVVERQSTTPAPGRNKSEPATSRTRFSIPPFPGPTFAPIYKPRTTTTSPATTPQAVTTETPPAYNTDYYNRQTYQSETSYPPYSGNQEYQTTTQNYYSQRHGNHFQETTYNYDYYQRDQTTARYDLNYYSDSGNYNSASVEQTTASYEGDYGNTESYRNSNVVTNRDVSQDTAVFPTTGTYGENRQRVETSTETSDDRNYSGRSTTAATTNYYDNANKNSWNNRAENESRFATRSPPRSSQNYRQNSISASTEKPWRSTQSYQQNNYQNSGATGKTLSPYDTSFTYQQGKVMSTLGPYVPFTKNYVYPITSTTTSKPPVYTATVPTYSSTIGNYRATAKSLIPKIKSPTAGKSKSAASYLPESGAKKAGALESRPQTEREHALSMLQSLSHLESKMQASSNRSHGGGASSSSAPSTLHSLALYFATANDSFDSKEATDSAVSLQYQPVTQVSKTENSTVELPTSILTQHTINSYAELFNLNNALEGNATAAESYNEDGDFDDRHDNSSDLDLEQSEGPVNGAKKSNGTKLRELAQVFTHALSAYLQDPDTFKKVLTEIRPTEPPLTTAVEQNDGTTQYPTTIEEYPSVTKEKDEVLDFSDDTNGLLRRKPTSYPTTTTQAPQTNTYPTFYPSEYYTTAFSPLQDNRYESTTFAYNEVKNRDQNNDYTTTTEATSNNYAFAVNNVFGQGHANDVSSYNPSGPDDPSQSYENYFPSGPAENRVGGFQNNTANTYTPYGKHVRPSDATPIADNYVVSSTPASYSGNQETIAYGENAHSADKQPDLELAPPFYENYGTGVPAGFRKDLPERSETTPSVTPIPIEIIGASSTSQPFRIRYYDEGKNEAEEKSTEESLVTARSAYNNYRTTYDEEITTTTPYSPLSRTLDPVTTVEDNSRQRNTFVSETKSPEDTTAAQSTGLPSNDQWTSSPAASQLWDSTAYIDPQNINHGLESGQAVTQAPLTDFPFTERTVRSTTPSFAAEVFTDASNEVTHGQNDPSTSWQWTANNNDSPTAFTLLPTAYSRENTATPTPIYTTSSSITTTITSSVTSTNSLPQDTLAPSLLPFESNGGGTFNATENEIVKANEMFGKLNASSTNTLMKVMRQADKNATVRQLVLLLINHCTAPTNKTLEEEKEQLLDALLRMPVNEFTSEESREIVAGITKLNLPVGRSRFVSISNPKARSTTTTTTTSTTTTAKPSVTTFRSRKGRKFRTSTTQASLSRRSDDTRVEESPNSLNDTTASDNRALELLRSLYTIAAKWG